MRKPSKTATVLLCAALAIVALGVWAASQLFEWKVVPHRVGVSAEARQNPYLAGELLLRHAGYDSMDTKERSAFTAGDFSHGTLMLASHEAFADAGMRYRLINWVQHGGHLVIPLEGSQVDQELLSTLGIHKLGWVFRQGKEDYVLPIEHQRLHVELPHPQIFRIEDQKLVWTVKLRGRFESPLPQAQNTRQPNTSNLRAFSPQMTQDPAYASPTSLPEREEEEDQVRQPVETVSLYARLRFGQGYVTVGSFIPFTNSHIDKHDQAMLFMRLMTLPDGRRPVRILYAQKYPDLSEWLFAHASEAWLGFALLILAGLWRLVPRFGPLLPEAPPVRPGLREHLSACGYFLLQRHAYEKLIAPLREEVQHALQEQRHRHPEIEDLTTLATLLSGIRTEEITRAMTPDPDSHQEFLRRVQTLATLRSLCKKLRKPFSATGVPL